MKKMMKKIAKAKGPKESGGKVKGQRPTPQKRGNPSVKASGEKAAKLKALQKVKF